MHAYLHGTPGTGIERPVEFVLEQYLGTILDLPLGSFAAMGRACGQVSTVPCLHAAHFVYRCAMRRVAVDLTCCATDDSPKETILLSVEAGWVYGLCVAAERANECNKCQRSCQHCCHSGSSTLVFVYVAHLSHIMVPSRHLVICSHRAHPLPDGHYCVWYRQPLHWVSVLLVAGHPVLDKCLACVISRTSSVGSCGCAAMVGTMSRSTDVCVSWYAVSSPV